MKQQQQGAMRILVGRLGVEEEKGSWDVEGIRVLKVYGS